MVALIVLSPLLLPALIVTLLLAIDALLILALCRAGNSQND